VPARETSLLPSSCRDSVLRRARRDCVQPSSRLRLDRRLTRRSSWARWLEASAAWTWEPISTSPLVESTRRWAMRIVANCEVVVCLRKRK
jgi:hypothetical protein